MDLNGGRIFVWIAKEEGRDLEGREMKGFDGYFLLRFESLQSWKDLKR